MPAFTFEKLSPPPATAPAPKTISSGKAKRHRIVTRILHRYIGRWVGWMPARNDTAEHRRAKQD